MVPELCMTRDNGNGKGGGGGYSSQTGGKERRQKEAKGVTHSFPPFHILLLPLLANVISYISLTLVMFARVDIDIGG